MSAPLCQQRVPLPDAVHTDHDPEAARPAGRNAGLSVLEHGAALRGQTEKLSAVTRMCQVPAYPASFCSRAVTPSTRASMKSAMPAATSTSLQLALAETTTRRSPASRTASRYFTEPS